MHETCASPLAIKLTRVAGGRKQRDLAQAINRSQSWLSRVEGNVRGAIVTGHDLSMMAQALGVNVSDLEAKG
jgi:transcriptional regulator with XRE-family HTH domain